MKKEKNNTGNNKIYFFGWTNIKWTFRQFAAMYSNKNSYFSKKRFESSIAFLGAMFIIIGNVIYHRDTITNTEILADAALLFAIAGYTVNQIQKEKKEIPSETNLDTQEELPPIKDDDDLEA